MNLFLTVGTQLPFDRLIRAVDHWAGDNPNHALNLFGQIGPVGRTNHVPQNFEWTEFLAPEAFSERFASATHILSHAGMGTIISAMVAGKPITILARRASLGEQRNDHQLATVQNFQTKPGIHIAPDEAAVGPAIEAMLTAVHGLGQAKPHADQSLTDAIRAEIMA
jgi:UDP-N-acetylglucosamine transferase subunit ALG13